MGNGRLLKMKKSTMIDIKKFYIAYYYSFYYNKKNTALLVGREDDYYDVQLLESIHSNHIDYKTPLSKYIGVSEGQISIKTAIEMAKNYFAVFNKENIGKPKRWEPKVLIGDTIPYLKVTNSLVDDSSTSDDLDLGI